MIDDGRKRIATSEKKNIETCEFNQHANIYALLHLNYERIQITPKNIYNTYTIHLHICT